MFTSNPVALMLKSKDHYAHFVCAFSVNMTPY